MTEVNLNKQQRKELVRKVSKASGVAQYAIEAKISDVDLFKLSENLEILELLKKANDYNRYCQGQKTAEANSKLKEIINQITDLKKSEIFKAGKWLINAILKHGEERKIHLLEKNLVHKDDYNETLGELTEVIEEQQKGLNQQTKIAVNKIKLLEQKNDELRRQLSKIEEYIINNSGVKTWQEIKRSFLK